MVMSLWPRFLAHPVCLDHFCSILACESIYHQLSGITVLFMWLFIVIDDSQ